MIDEDRLSYIIERVREARSYKVKDLSVLREELRGLIHEAQCVFGATRYDWEERDEARLKARWIKDPNLNTSQYDYGEHAGRGFEWWPEEEAQAWYDSQLAMKKGRRPYNSRQGEQPPFYLRPVVLLVRAWFQKHVRPEFSPRFKDASRAISWVHANTAARLLHLVALECHADYVLENTASAADAALFPRKRRKAKPKPSKD